MHSLDVHKKKSGTFLKMKRILLFLALLCAASAENLLRKRELSGITDYFECILIEITTEYDDDHSELEHICQGKDPDGDFDLIYFIDDNNDVIPDLDETGLDIIKNPGRFKLILTNIIENSSPVITTTPDTTVDIIDLELEADHRQLDRKLAKEGVRSLVIVRVTGNNGKQPKNNAEELSNAVFGKNGLKERYELCSMGKLSFEPAVDGAHIRNGVLEIQIDSPIENEDVNKLMNKANPAAMRKLGYRVSSAFHHSVFVFPAGTAYGNGGHKNWVAYAGLGSYFSVYNNEMAMMLPHLVHEIGHNLGLSHSTHGSDQYGDQSGFMGRGYNLYDGPQMCFNGAKFRELGWFMDKSAEVDPSRGSRSINLAFFGDYNKVPRNSQSDVVLIEVGYYKILYNKKKGINSETQEFGDKVTVTYSQGWKSRHDAALGPGQKFNLNESKNAVVEFCKATSRNGVDTAMISIYPSGGTSTCNSFDSGVGSGGGGQPVSPPSNPQTRPPTREPTREPTPPLTQRPTQRPVPDPTERPVPDPTERPLPPPTRAPVPVPAPAPAPTPISCTSDEIKIEVKLITNDSPEHIAWRLRERRGATIDQKNRNSYSGKRQEYIHKYCVNKKAIFEFHLIDSSGKKNPGGRYTISVDGEVYSEGDVVAEEVDYIQGECNAANKSRMQFILNTGTAPEGVSWSLEANDQTKYSGGPWTLFAGRSLHFFSNTCLDNSQCYSIIMRSSHKNVFTNEYDGLVEGSYEINWDNENVKYSTFDTGDKEVTRFGNCDDSYYEPPEIEDRDIPRNCDCTDNPIKWMVSKGWECENSYFLQTKCNKNAHWTTNKFCQLSCYEAGFGYPGDVCTCE